MTSEPAAVVEAPIPPAPSWRQTIRLSLRRAGALGACVGLLGFLMLGWRGAVVALIVGPVVGLLDAIERLARGGERSFARHVLGAAAGWLLGFATIPFVTAQLAYTGCVATGGSMDEAWGTAAQSLAWLARDPLAGAASLALLATPCALLVFVRARGLSLWEQLLLVTIGATLLFLALSPFTTLTPRGTFTTWGLGKMVGLGTSLFVAGPLIVLAILDRLDAPARRTLAAPAPRTP